MRVLAIETSARAGLVALADDEEVVSVQDGGRAGHLAEWLLPAVEQGLEEAGWRRAQLDLVVVGLGPGSFTGLRVGLATAKGLAVVLGVPLVGVDSLQVLAAAAPEGTLVAPMRASSRVAVEAGLYRVLEGDRAEVRMAPTGGAVEQVLEALGRAAGGEPIAFLGEGARRHEAVIRAVMPEAAWLEPARDVPRAGLLVRCGLRRWRQEGAADPLTLEPCYVRPVDAEPPKRVLGQPRPGGGG